MTRRWIVACCLVALACEDVEKRQLTEQWQMLERQYATKSQRLHAKRTAVDDAETRLDTMIRDLLVYKADVQTYLANHRLAADCIRTSRTSWNDPGPSNLSTLERVGGALCSAALLSRTFSSEVDAVTARLAEADRHVQKVEASISELRGEIEAKRKEIAAGEAELQLLDAERTDARVRLGVR